MLRAVDPNCAAFVSAATQVGLLVMDFDGVMTDNSVYVFEDGREAVRCSRFEGFGLRRLKQTGINSLIVSTEINPVVTARARKLQVEVAQGIDDKTTYLEEALANSGLNWRDICFIGNDINDLGALERCGLPVVVADAHESVLKSDFFITRRPGGHGAVRELCDALADCLR